MTHSDFTNSIFFKVTVVFAILLVLMIVLGVDTSRKNRAYMSEISNERYAELARHLGKDIEDSDLDEARTDLGFNKMELLCYERDCSFDKSDKKLIATYGEEDERVELFEDNSGKAYLFASYEGVEFVAAEKAKKPSFVAQQWVNIAFFVSIVALVLIYLLLLKILLPLKKTMADMRRFGSGDLAARCNDSSDDEIAALGSEFNMVAEKVNGLLREKEQLVADISHELRTPIMRGKLLLELKEVEKAKEGFSKIFSQMGRLVEDMLNSASISANVMNIKSCNILDIFGDISELLDGKQEQIELICEENFLLECDRRYFAMALKNLIENCFKYGEDGKAYIVATRERIEVQSLGAPLEAPFEHYMQPFVKKDETRGSDGYGLGLSITDKIFKAHNLSLKYRYENGRNIFFVRL